MWKIKNNRISIIKIENAYTNFLRENVDSRIPREHVGTDALPRPFVGIIISNNNIDYVIPLTSPKPKHKKMHNGIDFHKINGGAYGAINFNNMFPIIDDSTIYTTINTDLNGITDIKEIQYINLLRNQLTWLNIQKNKETVVKKAEKLYNAYCSNSLDSLIESRCCNFIELEKHYLDYKK